MNNKVKKRKHRHDIRCIEDNAVDGFFTGLLIQLAPKYSIHFDGLDWVATTTEFPGASGCANTPQKALKELLVAVKLMGEVRPLNNKVEG